MRLSELYEDINHSWFFNPKTKKSIGVADFHYLTVRRKPELFGLTKENVVDLSSERLIDSALKAGWVRCTDASSVMYVNGETIEDVKATIRYYRDMYSTFQIDIGAFYYEDSYRLDDPITIRTFLSARPERT